MALLLVQEPAGSSESSSGATDIILEDLHHVAEAVSSSTASFKKRHG